MPLWGNNDNVTGNNKPLYANTIVGVGSNSTINGATANQVYGSVYGVSAEEAANATSMPVTHAGWVSVKIGTGLRAGRNTHEVLVASGSITGDDSKDNTHFPGT